MYNQHNLKEVEWNLRLLIWRADYKGCNAWPKTESMIHSMNMKHTIATKYKQGFSELQSYIPDVPD